MKSPVMSLLLLSVLVLVACGGPQVDATLDEVQTENAQAMIAVAQETLVDEQGAVSVAITPLEVAHDAATLSFEVAMNTHSVDLGMDLAQLATLTTDTGAAVTATTWTGEAGGHHVSGVLSFPTDNDGAPLLEGATTITLILENVDGRERTFTWRVQ